MKTFDFIGRIFRQPLLLINLQGQVKHANQPASQLLFNGEVVANDRERQLRVDDSHKFLQYLKTCVRNLTLLRGSMTINDEKYQLEGMRYYVEGSDEKLILVIVYPDRALNVNFEQLNQIVDLKYEVSQHKVLEKRLTKQSEELLKTQKEILKLANYDHLTGLVSRGHFERVLSQAITNADSKTTKLALIYCDLDRFKKINDVFGHYIGDQLLREIGRQLQDIVGQEDSVSRFGGDEFVILLSDDADEAKISSIVEQIKAFFAKPLEIEGKELTLSISAGVSVFPDDSKSTSELLQHADLALSEAKLKRGNVHCLFSNELWEKHIRFNLIETELKKAIDQGDLYLHYQPQFDVHTRKVMGVEVLCRWHHDELGEITPGEFIIVAEKTGLISPLTVLVFEQALAQFEMWIEHFPESFDGLKLSLNVSATSLNDRKEFNHLLSLARNSKIPSSQICFEITETAIMSRPELSMELLTQSMLEGCHNAVDDFGVGSTSLDLLSKLPATILKIDMCFIKNICHSKTDYFVVEAVSKLASSLELYVIAEGVEEEAQLEVLRKMGGIDAVQGYLLSRPVDATCVPELMMSSRP